MKVLTLGLMRARLKRWSRFGGVALALLGGAVGVLVEWPQASVSVAENAAYPLTLRREYSQAVKAVHDLESRQRSQKIQVVSADDLSRQLSVVQLDADTRNFKEALADIRTLQKAVANWNLELNGGSKAQATVAAAQATAAAAAPAVGVNLPILLYHYPPPNFEQQLQHLEQAGYTAIDLDQALVGLHGGALPAKPVVITFDDGFSAQTSAYDALLRHHMKATFYIISGGEASQWCLGASRRYGDPLQPPGGCGDAYLNWDQIREMDRSGLITIAGHTVNHRNLATLSVENQRFEIQTGKQQIEAELGHSIRHFAYPYGAYNATSLELARQAGYLTAVTVQPGTFQAAGSDFTLLRVRDAMLLP